MEVDLRHREAASRVQLAHHPTRPLTILGRRVLLALAVLALTVGVVYLDREGYRDTTDGAVDFLDALYYSTVTLSTTGYGDVTPVSDSARLVNALLITVLRALFVLILVGTTIEVLTERSREQIRIARWRNRVHDHVVVCGYGTKGRGAVTSLLGKGERPTDIVVIDTDRAAISEANAAGLTGIIGSATRNAVLHRAEVAKAKAVIVAPHEDGDAVLTTLSARTLAPNARIVAAVREGENRSLLRQSGADDVVISAEASGRLLGLATESPRLVSVVEDLLTSGVGLDMIERDVIPEEVGKAPGDLSDRVLAVVRDGRVLRYDECDRLAAGDQVIGVRAP